LAVALIALQLHIHRARLVVSIQLGFRLESPVAIGRRAGEGVSRIGGRLLVSTSPRVEGRIVGW